MTIFQPIITLVGLMGSGKSRVGAELSALLGLPFVDSDREIEKAAGMPVADIFERFGETAFRDGEKKVLLRLLNDGPCVIATGGGAFIQPEIRAAIREKAVSVWLRADLDTLVARTAHGGHRPLLRGGDRKEKLRALMGQRDSIYAEADIVVDTGAAGPNQTAEKVLAALTQRAEKIA